MLKKANIQMTVKAMVNKVNKGEIKFDNAIQRGNVWDIDRNSLLIHSTMQNYPIPAFYFAKNENKYDALDGKQRATAFTMFLNGDFALSENIPMIYDEDGNETDVSNCHFENLPEGAQDAIRDYSLTIYYFEGITDDEIQELFYRINNGKPLTAIELTRVKAASIEIFQSFAKHDIVNTVISEKGKARYNDELLAMQSWAICFCEKPDFGTKAFRPLIENAIVNDSQALTINNCFDLINTLYNSLDVENEQDKRLMKKIKSRNHFVSCVYVAYKLIEKNNQQAFNSTVKAFFSTTNKSSTIDQDYNYSVGSGSAKAESIAKRINALNKII